MDACRCPQQPFTSADVSPSTQHEITASTLIPSPCLHGTHWPSESVSVHLQSSSAALKQPSPPLGETSPQSTPRPEAGDRSSFQERLHLSTLLRLRQLCAAETCRSLSGLVEIGGCTPCWRSLSHPCFLPTPATVQGQKATLQEQKQDRPFEEVH